MKLAPALISAALALVAASAQAAAKVELSFLTPDKYTDVGDGLRQENDNIKAIGDYVTQVGEKTLSDGQTLTIAFTDIDLAGRPNLMHREAGDYRIMTGQADWPRMRLHWVLQTPGVPDRSGDAELADMNYLWGIRPVGSDQPLYYDKRMFDRWFVKTFHVGKATPRGVVPAP